MTSRRPTTVPWYKERWPWLLMIPPAVAIIAGTFTLVLAVRSWDGLVSDDYYKEGLAIQRRIDRTARAAELGLKARVVLREGRITIWFEPGHKIPLPPLITVRLIHPTQKGKDQQRNLVVDQARYWAPLELPNAGKWHIEIEDESRQWRLSGTIHVPTEREELITSSVPDRS
jgi:hypothetical protein